MSKHEILSWKHRVRLCRGGKKKHVDAVFSVPNFFFGVKIEDLH